MQHLLQDIVAANVFAFLLIFMRLGTALMIMPGIGDSFVSMQARLLFALAFSFVLTPFLSMHLPPMPGATIAFALLMVSEALIGMFIGTIMRIMITALDTAGSIVSIQAGFSNAMIFNPQTASQGTMVGTLYSVVGVMLILTTDLHHYMLASIVESYNAFPSGGSLPGTAALSEAINRTVSLAFKTGVQFAMPFIVIGTLVQVGFGLLGRLMPQVQIFFLAMPVQIFLSLVMVSLTLSVGMMYWLDGFDAVVTQSLMPQ
jgi:flagellar biosynthetic protein FliR